MLVAACAGSLTIKGSSMAPTIHDGERVTYARYDAAAPQRGDIVVFQKSGTTRISRVVGLPGEVVRIVDGRVLVDGAPLPEPYLAPGTRTESATETFTVPADSYFVLGDNRSAANDSRAAGFGFVARGDIAGKLPR